MKAAVLACVLFLFAGAASAQTPIVLVLGTGELVIEVPLVQADAQLQIYKAYVDARPAQALTVLCGPKAGSPTVSQCATPLTALNLTAQHVVAVSASIVAQDGTVEGPHVALPFDLKRVGPPVGITPAGTLVRPTGQ